MWEAAECKDATVEILFQPISSKNGVLCYLDPPTVFEISSAVVNTDPRVLQQCVTLCANGTETTSIFYSAG